MENDNMGVDLNGNDGPVFSPVFCFKPRMSESIYFLPDIVDRPVVISGSKIGQADTEQLFPGILQHPACNIVHFQELAVYSIAPEIVEFNTIIDIIEDLTELQLALL